MNQLGIPIPYEESARPVETNTNGRDAMSSMAAALGTCGVLIGLPVADTLAAATVGGMMVNMGVGVARGGEHH